LHFLKHFITGCWRKQLSVAAGELTLSSHSPGLALYAFTFVSCMVAEPNG
jgi:hypothetical protein